jgi:hypothetical protein
MTSSLS